MQQKESQRWRAELRQAEREQQQPFQSVMIDDAHQLARLNVDIDILTISVMYLDIKVQRCSDRGDVILSHLGYL